MPSLGVIIGPNGLTVNAPVLGGDDRARNPRLTDVLHELLNGVRGDLQSQPLERGINLWCWEEGQGHQFFYVPVSTVISGVCCC